jgi:hypothetical protein
MGDEDTADLFTSFASRFMERREAILTERKNTKTIEPRTEKI